ncbi:MAG: TfoX/Sxy family protein [Pseudomonadota bacterium]
MAYDETQADLLRAELDGHPDIAEKKMFGGICFLLRGNMLCGVHKGGAMFRVGKDREGAARAIPGVSPLAFTGRRMGGMVETDTETLEEPGRMRTLLDLAFAFVGPMPAK